jgi:hypothetical protein
MSESCPKCGRPRAGDETACARCGLLVERWGSFVAEEPGAAAALDPLWAAAVMRWEAPSGHDKLLACARELGALPALARRYRAYLGGHPADAVAEARLKRLATLVEIEARAQAREGTPPIVPRVVWLVGVVAALALLGAALALLGRAFARH